MPITLNDRTITTVLFDLDGTLINHSTPRILANSAVVEYIKTQCNFSHLEIWNKMEQTYESIRQNWFSNLLQNLGLEPKQETIDFLIDLYYTSFDKGCIAYPDVLTLLEFLQDKVQLGILTDTDTYSSIAKLKHGNLSQYFKPEMITTYDIAGAKKPNAKIFEFALRQADCKPENCVYIGDIPSKDILGANQMGMTSIRLKRDTFTHKPTKDREIADIEIDNYYELLELIKTIA
jgi:putative hydrolase of the HAD superfamily